MKVTKPYRNDDTDLEYCGNCNEPLPYVGVRTCNRCGTVIDWSKLVSNDTAHYTRCDSCGESQEYTAIIKKPLTFIHKGKVTPIPQINKSGNKQDNTCLNCLQEDLNLIIDTY